MWLRSQLRRDAAGLLACPDDQRGLDSLTLSEGNAAAASRRNLGQGVGPTDGSVDSRNRVPSPGFVDPNGPPPLPQNTGPTGPLSSAIVELWLRGDSAVVDNGRVTRWTDLSNRSNHCYPVTSANAPTWSVDTDGLPMVTGDGATQWLNSTNFHSKRPCWLWLIVKLPSGLGVANEYPFRGTIGVVARDSGGGAVMAPVGTSVGFALTAVVGWQRSSLAGDAADTVNFFRVKEFLNGSTAIGSFPPQRSTIFARDTSGTFPSRVSIKEVVMTSGIPTASEIAAIEAYGIDRYGLGLFT